jgi:AraC-like DNA-binding protein
MDFFSFVWFYCYIIGSPFVMKPIQPDFRIEKTTRLLNENSSCTLAELAGACALSTSRLSHLFKAELGLTLGKFRWHLPV